MRIAILDVRSCNGLQMLSHLTPECDMLVIYNPRAGSARPAALERALAELPGAKMVETAGPGDAQQLAARGLAQGHRCIVAAGGDGTIADVATCVAGSGASLGILPLGSANVFAQELGLPLDVTKAARIVQSGIEVTLHPGVAKDRTGQERFFVQTLGVGFDATVVHRLNLQTKQRLGRLAYVLKAITELPRYTPEPLLFRADEGPEEKAAGILVMKGRLYGGRYIVARGATPFQPGFTLIIQRKQSRAALLLAALSLPINCLAFLPFIEVRKCTSLMMKGIQDVQADGDPLGSLPMTVFNAPKTLTVRVSR